MNNKAIITVLAVGLTSVFIGCSKEKDETQQLPNIVFVLADDMGCVQLGCYGSSYYQTPNINNLASEGMRFPVFVAGTPNSEIE